MRRDLCCRRNKNCWRRKRNINCQLFRGKLPVLRKVWWKQLKVKVQGTTSPDRTLIRSNLWRPRCPIWCRERGNLKIPLTSWGKSWDLQNQEPTIPTNWKSATAREAVRISCSRAWSPKTGKEKPCLRRPDSKASRRRWKPTNKTGRWTPISWGKTTSSKATSPNWRFKKRKSPNKIQPNRKISNLKEPEKAI